MPAPSDNRRRADEKAAAEGARDDWGVPELPPPSSPDFAVAAARAIPSILKGEGRVVGAAPGQRDVLSAFEWGAAQLLKTEAIEEIAREDLSRLALALAGPEGRFGVTYEGVGLLTGKSRASVHRAATAGEVEKCTGKCRPARFTRRSVVKWYYGDRSLPTLPKEREIVATWRLLLADSFHQGLPQTLPAFRDTERGEKLSALLPVAATRVPKRVRGLLAPLTAQEINLVQGLLLTNLRKTHVAKSRARRRAIVDFHCLEEDWLQKQGQTGSVPEGLHPMYLATPTRCPDCGEQGEPVLIEANEYYPVAQEEPGMEAEADGRRPAAAVSAADPLDHIWDRNQVLPGKGTAVLFSPDRRWMELTWRCRACGADFHTTSATVEQDTRDVREFYDRVKKTSPGMTTREQYDLQREMYKEEYEGGAERLLDVRSADLAEALSTSTANARKRYACLRDNTYYAFYVLLGLHNLMLMGYDAAAWRFAFPRLVTTMANAWVGQFELRLTKDAAAYAEVLRGVAPDRARRLLARRLLDELQNGWRVAMRRDILARRRLRGDGEPLAASQP